MTEGARLAQSADVERHPRRRAACRLVAASTVRRHAGATPSSCREPRHI
ncbi:hypothetical protein K788_0002757 [Paraburkholderia caribensis MBA4]|uniref:Uncharacterized protein n=1 Tax=Paraburkholderia caribensis MBA4 TaxID=1323664 RepID=A0A0P0RCZ7_9BURK|nr:hypothetical protein K788_0002757 [Paraburkholderia caribensis MBA4]